MRFAERVTLKVTCPMGKGPGKSSTNNIINYNSDGQEDRGPGKAKCDSCLPRGSWNSSFFLAL